MANKKESTEVAQAGSNALAFIQNQAEGANLPSFLKENDTRGQDNITSADLTLPRLRLLQYISDEVKPKNDAFVEGAVAGMMIDSISKELFDKVYLIPSYYERKFNVWRTRDAGGGLVASCYSETEARAELIAACEAEKISIDDEDRVNATFEIIDTPTHYCLRIDPETGNTSPVIVDMPSTKQKVSRGWNTEMKRQQGPSFAHVWEVSSVEETNKRNEDYFNYRVKRVGWATEELFKKGEETYESFRAQAAVDREVASPEDGE